MEIFLTILESFGLILLGVVMHSLYKAVPYLQSSDFSIGVWWKDNAPKLLWSLLTSLAVALLIVFAPDGLSALSTLGLNIPIEIGEEPLKLKPGVLVFTGISLYSLTRAADKTKKLKAK